MLETFVPDLDPVQLVSMLAVFLIAGTIKGFLGIGLPAAAMGLLTFVMAPTEAIPLLWLPILATNFLQFANAPNKRGLIQDYGWFAVAIIVSIFVTSMFIASYPTALLTVVIGIAMVVFSLNLLIGIKLAIGPSKGWQVGFGLLSGTLGGLSSIWSPTVAMYLVARNATKEQFIGATGFLFLAGCVPLGLGQVVAGILTLPVLLQSLLGLAVALVGFRVGAGLRESVSQTLFRKAVLIAFLIMGVRLIATGLI